MTFIANSWIDYLIIAIYMAVVVGVGFLFTNKNETTENYLMGNRRLPVFAVGLSCLMSLLSSISIVNVPGEIFNHGYTLFAISFLTCWWAIPCYMMFTRFYFKLGSFTPYEYLEYRYDKTVRTVIAISAFYSRIFYLGMVLYTTSKIFEGAYGWPSWVSILLAGGIGVVYTVMGGMKAVVWTDVIQFFVLLIGMIVIISVLCLNIEGGAVEAVACAFREGHGVPQFSDPDFYKITPYTRLLFFLMLWGAIIGPISGASSDQINIQRLLATGDFKKGLRSQILSTCLGFGTMILLGFIGFAVFTYYHQNPQPGLTGDLAFFRFIATKAPAPIPGFFMAAMLAAIMSTLDSGMNSMVTIWLKEFHCRFFNRNMTAAQEISVSRWATFWVGIVAIALGLALVWSGTWLKQSVAEVQTLFGLLGAATIPAFLFAVFSKRTNSTLIWAYTFFSSGEALGMSTWYALSRKAVQRWAEDPSAGLGWGGPLPLVYFLVLLIPGLLLIAPYCCNSCWRKKLWSKLCALVGSLVLGYSSCIGLWWTYSTIYVKDVPLECSFAFGLPISLALAFALLRFFPVQPREKWQGLILSSINEPILVKKDS